MCLLKYYGTVLWNSIIQYHVFRKPLFTVNLIIYYIVNNIFHLLMFNCRCSHSKETVKYRPLIKQWYVIQLLLQFGTFLIEIIYVCLPLNKIRKLKISSYPTDLKYPMVMNIHDKHLYLVNGSGQFTSLN